MPVYREPSYYQDAVHGKLPDIFARGEAPDGDAEPWVSAPIGTLYIRTDAGNVTLFIKEVDNGADADWQDYVTP